MLPDDTKRDLCVNALLYATPHIWKAQETDNYIIPKWQVDFTKVLQVRNITQAISEHNKPSVHNVWNKWEEELGTPFLAEHWPGIAHRRKHITQIKIRSFYVCFAFRAYVTNIQLHHMGTSNTDQCSFCNAARETRMHLF